MSQTSTTTLFNLGHRKDSTVVKKSTDTHTLQSKKKIMTKKVDALLI